MGSVVASGLGSGLDIAGLVQKLVQAEGEPKSLRLNAEEAKVQAKLSALGTLRSALSNFRSTVATLKDIAKFQGRSASVSSEDFLAASASATAAPGAYSVEVQALAAAQKLQSTDFDSAAYVVGTGTLRITVGQQSYDVAIGSQSQTLGGIAAAINSSTAGSRVVATVINGTDASRLTLTARASGTANAITSITQSGGNGGLAALVYPPSPTGLTQIQEGANAEVLIDGVPVTSSTNTISGAIAGVELTLVKQNALSETTVVTVGYDRAAARKTVDDFVKSYNAVVDAIKNVSGYNAETRESGPLFGDAGVRNIVDQLRRELTSNAVGLSGEFDMLAEIGVTADLSGKLSVNGTKLDAAFNADFDAIGELFAADNVGVAVKLDKLLAPYLDSNGIFDSRTAGLKTSIDDINERRAALTTRPEALHVRYTKQFNALDSLLSQLQSTSNFLSQQLSRLPGATPLRSNGQ